MKSVMIIYNQTHTDRVEFLLQQLNLRGFTKWESVQGRGTESGEPRLGTHTWPEMNSANMLIVEDDQVIKLLEYVKALDDSAPEVGIRAFVWNIEQMV